MEEERNERKPSRLSRRELFRMFGVMGAAVVVETTIHPPAVSAGPSWPFLRPPPEVAPIPDMKEGVDWREGVIYRGPRDKPQVAITIDDGYCLDGIKTVCDLVEKHHLPLTFFIYGEVFKGSKHQEQIKRAFTLGCELQNHTYTHPNLVKLLAKKGKEGVEKEIQSAQKAIFSITGEQGWSGRFLRPPGGNCNAEVVQVCDRLGLTAVNWSASSDGIKKAVTPGKILESLSNPAYGDIVLMHFQGLDPSVLEDYWLKILQPAGIKPVLLSDLIIKKN